MSILITGGLGYIGSHIAKISENKKIVIIDNQSNSNLDFEKTLPNAKVFLNEITFENLNSIFKKYEIKEVIHLAGLKSVSDSIDSPLSYYKNNVVTTLNLLESMDKFRINKLIFSSSATVYGNNNSSPLSENLITSAINPYGETKIVNENIIRNYCNKNKNFSAVCLRYFNPVGAHDSGELKDNPLGSPQNLMPLIINAAKGGILKIYGNDYPTKDGTCLRDYIHVVDLAEAHLECIDFLDKNIGFEIFNVGLGKGISVLELISLFEKTNKVRVNYEFTSRRHGDSAISYASNKKIKKMVNWHPKKNYTNMCKDAWNAR